MADWVPYDLYLGTFEGEEFKWKKVQSFQDWKKAYKTYKDFINKQIHYTDEELRKVWSSGRLDIELKQGKKLLNWVGIYCRKVDKEDLENDKDNEQSRSKASEEKPDEDDEASADGEKSNHKK